MSDSPPSSVPSRFPSMPSASPTTPSLPATTVWGDSDGAARAGGAFAGAAATPAEIGAPTIGHIGRYALKYRLGSGGLGTVFAAHDPLLSRLIAVKTLNVEIGEEERESFNAIFINEARAAGGLSHPHIVTVFDAGVSDNRAYIAMELLKGKDLRQLMQEGWRATPAQAVLIVRRVADALAYAHSKGVIHRDVKPANIFMVGRTQPRVVDFGIARLTRRHGRDASAGAGSPYYMAPEQVRRAHTDRRADVFSLGVVLYELLTATKPFTGGSLEAIAAAVQRHEPPLASKVDPTVPTDLARIVARAMQKDPDQRFRSARSFARELRQWLDVHPVGVDGESSVAASPRHRLKPLTLLAGIVLAAAGAGAAGVATWRAMPPIQAMTPAPTILASPAVPNVVVVEPAVTVASRTPVSDATLESFVTIEPTVASLDAVVEAVPSIAVPPVPVTARSITPQAAEARTIGAAKESARDRRLLESRVRELRDREARAAVAAAAPSTGKVRIAVSPWGLVEVDGLPAGAAPPLTELVLAEGRHRIIIRNGDETPFSTTVDVVAGQSATLRYRFP